MEKNVNNNNDFCLSIFNSIQNKILFPNAVQNQAVTSKYFNIKEWRNKG